MLFHNQARCKVVKIISKRHSVPARVRLEDNRFGYVLSGALKIHYPEHTVTVLPGEVFFACAGPHCVEYSDRYSAIYLRFDDQAVINALNVLSPRYDMLDFPPDTAVSDSPVCRCWPELKRFFFQLKDDMEPAVLKLRLCELLLLLISHNEYECQAALAQCVGRLTDSFERIVRESVFEHITVKQLAERTHRNLTAFKQDFRRTFHDTPHRWLLKQRLLQARFLIIGTQLPIGRIATETGFDNVSHFIKLFRQTYQMTPLALRKTNRGQL